MEKKYRLLKNDTITVDGKTLYRIEALRDFADVKKGDKGGYIESEDNLSTYSSFCRIESSLTTDIHWCSQQFKRFRDISTFEIVQ